jgi:hypothetical protein
MMETWNTGILGLDCVALNNSYAFRTIIPFFHVAGIKPVSIKATCFQHIIEVSKRLIRPDWLYTLCIWTKRQDLNEKVIINQRGRGIFECQ